MGARLLTGTAIAGLLALAGTAAVVLLDSPEPDSSVAPSILGAPDGSVLAAGLVQPTDCADLGATMEQLAEEYGWHGGPEAFAVADTTMGGRAAAEESDGADQAAAAAPAEDSAGGDTTNVQEAGVDEPDIVERVGEDLVVVGTEGTVRVVDVSSGTPVARGELAIEEWGGDLGLFAVGEERVAVLAQGEGLVREDLATSMVRPGGWGTTVVTLVDLADPDAPREVSRMELEGWMVDARAVDGVLRLAVRSEGPQLDVHAMGEFAADREMDWENASPEDHRRYEQEYQAEYERRMAEARAQLRPEHWQPHATVDGRTVPLVGCDRIGFPTSFSGMGTLTLAAVDARGDSLRIDDAEAVVTSGENLYATTDRVVIATTRFEPCCPGVPEPMPIEPEPAPVEPTFEPAPVEPVEPVEPSEEPAPEPTEQPTTPVEPTSSELPVPPTESPTEEQAADVVATATTSAMIDPAIGSMIAPWGPGGTTDLHVFDVEGTLVSHVASGSVDGSLLNQYSMSIHDGVLRTATTAATDGRTESLVTTFRVEGTDLVQLGQVGDLGPDEDIQAVRFMGTTAYVVTFRRTDPLYVVDLTDPTAPRTRGELKIEGYSAYLHPLGDGRLLGVGQDADPSTGMTRGVQVSTFDVTDPTAPRRIDVDVTPGSSSEVEWEPHALTVTGDGLAVVPLEIWDQSPNGRLGALVYRVGADGSLERQGRLDTGSDWMLRPRRTLDLGSSLLTVGDRGVVAWDRAGFEVAATVRFAAPAGGGEHGLDDGGSAEPGFDPTG